MALRIAVRDAERGVAAHWEAVQELEKEVAQMQTYLEQADKRHKEAAGWLNGLLKGLRTLEDLHVEVGN